MGLENSPQSPLGRIDPGLVVPRIDENLNSPSATTAMVEAFRTGQISAADIADRASKRALVEAAIDPETVAAQKASIVAKGKVDTLTAQQAAEAALVPVYLQNQYKALLDAGIPIQADFKNDPQGAAKQVYDSFRGLMQFHAEAMNAKSILASTKEGGTASIDPATQTETVTQGPVDTNTGEALNPDAIHKVKDWNNQYANNVRAWMANGNPPVETNVTFSTPGTVQAPPTDAAAAPAAVGAVGISASTPPAAGGRVSSIKLPPNLNQRPTDLQSKALYFTTASKDADGNLAKLVKEGFDPASFSNSVQEGLSTITFGATERFKPDALKQYNAAAFAWTDSFLRMQSGAAVGEKETAKLARGYFTQGGDSPATQQQKAKTRAKLELMGQAVVSGRPITPADQAAMDDSREQATAFSDLHEKAVKPGKKSGIFPATDRSGRKGTVDNTDPGNPRFIPDDSGPLVQPK